MMGNLINFFFFENSILTIELGSILIVIYIALFGYLYNLNYKIEDRSEISKKAHKYKKGEFDEDLNKLLQSEFISILLVIVFYFLIKIISLINVNFLHILIVLFFVFKYIKIIRHIYYIRHIIYN